MKNNIVLTVLGYAPAQLNILLELAEEAKNITSFNILKNIPSEATNDFIYNQAWNIKEHDYYADKSLFNPRSEDNYALSVVGPKSKNNVYNIFKQFINLKNEQFINLLHPTAYVSRSASLNYGLQLESLSTIAACSRIGFGVNIKRNCSIGHHSEINDFTTINPGSTLSSFVKIGKNTMIGSGTSIKDNITIGENTIIGIGSVVVKDIPSNAVAYGNPCVVHKKNGF